MKGVVLAKYGLSLVLLSLIILAACTDDDAGSSEDFTEVLADQEVFTDIDGDLEQEIEEVDVDDQEPEEVDLVDLQDESPDEEAIDALDHVDEELPSPEIPRHYLSEQPYTTLQKSWRPLPLPTATHQEILDGDMVQNQLDRYDDMGLGVEEGPGEPWIEDNSLAPDYDEAQLEDGDRRSLLYFWQSADPQLIDEESPIRMEGFYKVPMASAYRPQSHLTTQVFEAHVRSARRISDLSGRPFDFAHATGDLVDGGQANELIWFGQIMAGGIVHPDSGVDDDAIPGVGNDHSDPFWSEGIGVPWYAAVGNHEVLYLGFTEATETMQEAAVGDQVIDLISGLIPWASGPGFRNGYRAGDLPDAPVIDHGETPADPLRRISSRTETLELIASAGGEPAGHGFSDEMIAGGIGYYSFYPIEGKPIRAVVLNTLAEVPASSEGALDVDQYNWLLVQLSEATAAGEVVIVFSHHRTGNFHNQSPISGEQFAAALQGCDNVLLHLTGHGHYNRKELFPSTRPMGLGHWELMVASTVDFPMHTRIIELVYEGQGYLSVYVTNLDHNSPNRSMAADARKWAAGRRLISDPEYLDSWLGEDLEARNLLLRYKLPQEMQAAVESHSWPTRVESTETLLTLGD